MPTIDVEVLHVRKMSGDGKLKAFADIKIAGQLVVKGFGVMEGPHGIFVSMPKQPTKDGRWFETVTPLNKSFKDEIQNKVLEAYDKENESVPV